MDGYLPASRQSVCRLEHGMLPGFPLVALRQYDFFLLTIKRSEWIILQTK